MVDNPIEWIKRNFFSKRNFTDVSNGAVDAFRPVVLNIAGYLDRTLFGSELDVDGPIVAVFNSRYRIGIQPLSGTTAIFSYDSTAAAYIPLVLDGSAIILRPSADGAKAFEIDASGNIQASARVGGAWTNLTYTNAGGTTWADFAGGFQIGQYKKFGDLVFVRGLAKRTAGAGTTIATLPSGFRPSTSTQLFSSLAYGGAGRVDIDTSGNIVDMNGVGATWISLNLLFSTL